MFLRIFFLFTSFLLPNILFANLVDISDIGINRAPSGTILTDGYTFVGILTLAQSILLKVVLPLVIVGVSLYTAYQLFTAEGDEAKLKNAWRSLTFSGIALVIIALSYALVSIFSNIRL